MARVTVVGAGMMGTALTFPLADAGHEVRLVGTHLDDGIVDALVGTGVHPGLGVSLPPGVEALPHAAGAGAIHAAELIGVGVSSAGIGWVGELLAAHARPGAPVIMITKGLALRDGALELLPDALARRLPPRPDGGPAAPVAVAGPCIAGELARRVPTAVVLTGRDGALVEQIAALVATRYYHPFVDRDAVGVEVCAALKNAYAMGVAFGAGLHERTGGVPGSVALHNYEAAVFAQSVHELQQVVGALGGMPATAAGLAGVGDLDVTCNGGRTGRFGKLLGAGIGVARARAALPGVTLECLEILAVLRAALPGLERAGGLEPEDLPLLRHLAAVALDDAPVDLPFARFFGRGGSRFKTECAP